MCPSVLSSATDPATKILLRTNANKRPLSDSGVSVGHSHNERTVAAKERGAVNGRWADLCIFTPNGLLVNYPDALVLASDVHREIL